MVEVLTSSLKVRCKKVLKLRGGLLFLSPLVLALNGCVSSDISDLDRYIQEIKDKEYGEIEPLPEIKIFKSYTYASAAQPDPFAPLVSDRDTGNEIKESEIQPDPHSREELESYPLDSLRMVGTLQLDALYGLIRTSEGTIHRVLVGNYMGQNNGRISSISEEQIKLTEKVQVKPRFFEEREASLALSQ